MLDEAVNGYLEVRPKYKDLALKAEQIVRDLLQINNINYHSLECRVKSVESFRAKLESDKYREPLKEITDFAGIRIICYVNVDVDTVTQLIYTVFEIDEENSLDKSSELGSSQVGYRSNHVVCSLTQERCQLPEYAKLKGLKFEVQIRTILQHAWAEIGHDRNYKYAAGLPPDLQRRFNLLAGTLELIDREFNDISKSIDRIIKRENKEISDGDLEVALRPATIQSYFIKKFKKLVEEAILIPSFGGARNAGSILDELHRFGIKTIKDLDKIVPDNLVENPERHIPVGSNIISILRLIMLVNDYKKYFRDAYTGNWVAISKANEEFLSFHGLNMDDINQEYRASPHYKKFLG